VKPSPEAYLLAAVVATAAALRLSFVVPGVWEEPWTPHHFDEHVLPYEAVALWEGVTPREVGWPAGPFRLALSAAYVGQLVADERGALTAAESPEAAMATVARWSGRRVTDAAPLYVIGRTLSALIGVLQVMLAMLAAREWLGRSSMPIAGALAAVSPLAVTHSQLVLADVSGACFTTLLLALIPRAVTNPRLAPWLGAAAGLAAASKFHFGIWLLLPVAAFWIARSDGRLERHKRWAATLALLAGFGLVLVACVPWFWTNAPLEFKEFAGVVLVKAGGGAGGAAAFVSNAARVLVGIGAVILVGAIIGALPLIRQWGALGGAVVALTVVSVGLLCASAIVFDRYGLVVLPALTLTATAGWQWVSRRWPRLGSALPIALLVLGLPQSWFALDEFRHIGPYHAAHAWMIAHLPDRASVVIYSEDNQYLPRTDAQLAECETYVGSDAAYREKLATNGVVIAPASGMPMRLAVVNDELFHAYWCSREKLSPRESAFVVRRFHAGPRFQTLDVPSLEREFRAGLTDPSRGFDAVLVHWPLFPDLRPIVTFQTPRGPALQLYARPGLRLRDRLDP
jgi:hypothetical protein